MENKIRLRWYHYLRFPIMASILAVISGLMPGKGRIHLISSILSLVTLLSSAIYCGFAILTLVRNDIGLFWKVLFGMCVILSGMISIFGHFLTACSIKNPNIGFNIREIWKIVGNEYWGAIERFENSIKIIYGSHFVNLWPRELLSQYTLKGQIQILGYSVFNWQ